MIKKKPRIIFICDAKFSSSPKKLANSLQEKLPQYKFITRLKSRPTLAPHPKRTTIPWGITKNKLQQYQAYKEHNLPHPEWTTSLEVANNWIHNDNCTVVGRSLLNSFGGKGIILFDKNNPIPLNHNCKVFTKYKKKKHEYRIHVFQNAIIDFAQKKKSKDANNNNNVNTQIRNFKNGWVYCRENVTLPTSFIPLAINAVKALNLTWGAVDIIYNEYENQAYILEVNTAPGLMGSTVESYSEAFKHWILENEI